MGVRRFEASANHLEEQSQCCIFRLVSGREGEDLGWEGVGVNGTEKMRQDPIGVVFGGRGREALSCLLRRRRRGLCLLGQRI